MSTIFPLTDPRLTAEFDDWPLGGDRRGRCVFAFERHPKRGWRVGRTTFGQPKYHTYGGPGVVATGADGRTYVVQRGNYGDGIYIHRSDFMSADPAAVYPGSPNYAALVALITAGHSAPYGTAKDGPPAAAGPEKSVE